MTSLILLFYGPTLPTLLCTPLLWLCLLGSYCVFWLRQKVKKTFKNRRAWDSVFVLRSMERFQLYRMKLHGSRNDKVSSQLAILSLRIKNSEKRSGKDTFKKNLFLSSFSFTFLCRISCVWRVTNKFYWLLFLNTL